MILSLTPFSNLARELRGATVTALRNRCRAMGLQSPPDFDGLHREIAVLRATAEFGPEAVQAVLDRPSVEKGPGPESWRIFNEPRVAEAEVLDQLLLTEFHSQETQPAISEDLDLPVLRQEVAGVDDADADDFFEGLDGPVQEADRPVRTETAIGALRLLRHNLSAFMGSLDYARLEKGIPTLSRPIARALAVGAADALDLVVTKIDQVERDLALGTPVGLTLECAPDLLWERIRASIASLRVGDAQAKLQALEEARRELAGELAVKLLNFIEAIDFDLKPGAVGLVKDDLAARAFHAGAEEMRSEMVSVLRQALTDLRTNTPLSLILNRQPDNIFGAMGARDAIEKFRQEAAHDERHHAETTTPNEPSKDGGKEAR
jgi:hypothetical protein